MHVSRGMAVSAMCAFTGGDDRATSGPAVTHFPISVIGSFGGDDELTSSRRRWGDEKGSGTFYLHPAAGVGGVFPRPRLICVSPSAAGRFIARDFKEFIRIRPGKGRRVSEMRDSALPCMVAYQIRTLQFRLDRERFWVPPALCRGVC